MGYLLCHPLGLPMKPPPVVSRQDGIRASLLEASDQHLQEAEGASDQLGAAERLQAAAVLQVVLLNKVVDAHGRVAVRHVESTPCRREEAGMGVDIPISTAAGRCFSALLGPTPGQQSSTKMIPNQQFSDYFHVT